MKVLAILLGLGSALCAFIGLISLSEATMGVGIIAFGAVVGIIARLCQAEANHTEIKKTINQIGHESYMIKHILETVHNIKKDEDS
jgi:hypothetical protein